MGVGLWEGFPLSHIADGADVSGCSQSQQGQVYPAAVWKSRDTSPSHSALLLVHYQPQAKLPTFVYIQRSWHTARPLIVAKFSLVKVQASESARCQSDVSSSCITHHTVEERG